MRIIVTFLLGCVVCFSQAQNIVRSLERRVAGEGTVTVHQDIRIADLIGPPVASSSSSSSSVSVSGGNTSENSGERRFLRAIGYRVQVYAGNNSRSAREEAAAVSARVKEYFPKLPVYTHFSSPRWLCRVGDFKSIEEADAMMRKLRATGVFKEVSIVKEQINIPL